MNFFQRFIQASLFVLGYHLQQWTEDRPTRAPRSQLAREAIPYQVRRRMLDWARKMEQEDPLFNRFLDLCEQYVIGPTGLRILSASSDARYRQAANAEFESWQPFCDVASLFSFGRRQSLIEREISVAGEVFILKTFGSTGRPRIQLFPSEAIETPMALQGEKDIFDGVRLEKNGRPISYFVITGPGPKDFDEIETERMLHLYDPSLIGQVRGLTIIYPVLKHMVDRGQLQDLEMLAAKDHSRMSRVIKTASGQLSVTGQIRARVPQSTQNNSGQSVQQTASEYYEKVLGAETKVLRNGDSMELLQSNRPSVAVQAFWDHIQAMEGAGMGLPIEIMVMRSLQGTMGRGAFDMANDFFRCRSAARAEDFSRIFRFVVQSSTNLRKIQPLDWWKTDYTPPKAINVDVGRNSAADVAMWQAGLKSLKQLVGPHGMTPEEFLEERARDFELARDTEQRHGLPPGSIFPLTTGEQQTQPEPTDA